MSRFIELITCLSLLLVPCITLERKTNQKKECQFPFMYNGEEYEKCTDVGKTKGNFWCATEVDQNNRYLENSGEFGTCHANCARYEGKQ